MDSIRVDLQSLLELQQNLTVPSGNSIEWESLVIGSLSTLVALVTAIATGITVYITYIALTYAKKEYSLNKKIRESEILAKYNERYSTDPHIDRVIRSFNKELDLKEKVTLNDKEMFLRFFEELQFTIEQEGLSKEVVYEMFSFYALKAAEKGKSFVDDYGEKYWRRFINFTDSMKEVEETIRLKNKKRK